MIDPQVLLGSQRKLRAPAQRHEVRQSQSTKTIPAYQRSKRISQRRRNCDGRKLEKRQRSLSIEEISIQRSPYNPGLFKPVGLQDQPLPLPSKRQKLLREAADPTNYVSVGRPRKRLQPSPVSPSDQQTFGQEISSSLSASQQGYISHWIEQKTWPKEYFQRDKMSHLFARSKPSASLGHTRSAASRTDPTTPSDQRSREEKRALYRHASYPALLETLGDSYMDEYELGVTDASKALHKNLLKERCPTPKGTLFCKAAFDTACRNLRDKNEARIVQDIARLLAPSPENLAASGTSDLAILVESVNEAWNNSYPITSSRPQPDFSVGFRRSVFSDNQFSKIQPFLGDFSSLSYFRATHYLYFPFLTCEVKCGATGLDIADRQNAHSMTLAVRGIAELFKLVKRENELHRGLQTFSISHDHRTVRLYGYYPVFDGTKTKIYRRQIHTFDFTALNGKERWTTYKFTVAVYHYSLTLLERIRSLIDDLPPDFDLRLAQQSNPQLFEPSGLSQRALAEEPDSQSGQFNLQQITPGNSRPERPVSGKKNRKKKMG